MSRKMKRVALDSSPYGVYDDAKTRFKHQTLIQDYQELEKETEAVRSKLVTMKQRKLTLLAEVRFLRQRYKFLIKNKSSNLPVQLQNSETQSQKNMKDRIQSKKKLTPHKSPQNFDLNQKGKLYIGNDAAPLLDLNHKETLYSGKEATFHYKTPVPDLNMRGRIYNKKEAAIWNPTPAIDLNHKERMYGGNDAAPRNHTPVFDLNKKESTFIGKEAALKSRAPIFDLNQISREEEEYQNNCEPLRFEDQKRGLIRGANDELHNDLKLSVCRNLGDSSNRVGKRKISWQDPVALRV